MRSKCALPLYLAGEVETGGRLAPSEACGTLAARFTPHLPMCVAIDPAIDVANSNESEDPAGLIQGFQAPAKSRFAAGEHCASAAFAAQPSVRHG